MRRTCKSIAKRYGLPHWAVLSIVHFLKFNQVLPNLPEAAAIHSKLSSATITEAYVDMLEHAEGKEGTYDEVSTQSDPIGRDNPFKS